MDISGFTIVVSTQAIKTIILILKIVVIIAFPMLNFFSWAYSLWPNFENGYTGYFTRAFKCIRIFLVIPFLITLFFFTKPVVNTYNINNIIGGAILILTVIAIIDWLFNWIDGLLCNSFAWYSWIPEGYGILDIAIGLATLELMIY